MGLNEEELKRNQVRMLMYTYVCILLVILQKCQCYMPTAKHNGEIQVLTAANVFPIDMALHLVN